MLSDSSCRGSWSRLALERVERMRKSCCIKLLEKRQIDQEGAEEVFVLSSASRYIADVYNIANEQSIPTLSEISS